MLEDSTTLFLRKNLASLIKMDWFIKLVMILFFNLHYMVLIRTQGIDGVINYWWENILEQPFWRMICQYALSFCMLFDLVILLLRIYPKVIIMSVYKNFNCKNVCQYSNDSKRGKQFKWLKNRNYLNYGTSMLLNIMQPLKIIQLKNICWHGKMLTIRCNAKEQVKMVGRMWSYPHYRSMPRQKRLESFILKP